MKNIIVLLFSIGLVFLSGCKDSKAQDVAVIKVIPVAQFEENIKNEDVQLVDVRTVAEFNSGHLKGAENIVYKSDAWNSSIAKLDKSKPVYVYCKAGGRSAKCASLLEEAGFKMVYDLEGGITQWQREGRSLEQ